MTGYLIWLAKVAGILALAVIVIILAVLVFGLLFAIGYGIYEGWKDGDGDG